MTIRAIRCGANQDWMRNPDIGVERVDWFAMFFPYHLHIAFALQSSSAGSRDRWMIECEFSSSRRSRQFEKVAHL
jgi:hypothetical protein